MTQNRSTAVMQRRLEPHHSLDDYPTPPWATRALCEWLSERGHISPSELAREPAANRGHMVRPLREYFAHVEASDIHDYGAGLPELDYLFGPLPPVTGWTITNPPFRLAEQFIARALVTSESGVAMIVRSAFLEGVGRHERLFSTTPPTDILQFTERVVMHKGKLSPKGSTATAYCWLVWDLARDDNPGTHPTGDPPMTTHPHPLSGAVKMLNEQDREYNRKTNALIARHAEQVAVLSARVAELEGDRGWQTVAESNQQMAQSWQARAEAAEAALAAARDKALEEAMGKCKEVAEIAKDFNMPQMAMGAHQCRDAIRAMKGKP